MTTSKVYGINNSEGRIRNVGNISQRKVIETIGYTLPYHKMAMKIFKNQQNINGDF